MAALQQKNKELSDTDGLPEGWEEGKKIKYWRKQKEGTGLPTEPREMWRMDEEIKAECVIDLWSSLAHWVIP